MRLRRTFAAICTALSLVIAAPAQGQDSLAPPGAPKHWLPNEEWVNLLWLPYDEARLYRLLGHDRGFVFRWIRDEKTLAELGRHRGWTVDRLADALVAPRRGTLDARRFAMVRERAERTLTQGHLGQHLLFHALHQTAVPARAEEIFGTRTREEFLKLRRAELSPLHIGELNGRTRVEMTRNTIRALTSAATLGIREGTLTPRQAQLMLDRQLRAVPRWLGQSRYNGPSGGRNRALPSGDYARHPSISSDGSTVVWDAYRATIGEAERLGEIHVRAARLSTGARFAISAGRRDPRRPRSAYNCVISPGGGSVAFESSESTYPLAKRVGQMTVMVRDLATGAIEHVSHEHRGSDRGSRTAFNPSISSDGRIVVFEATDAGVDGKPSHNGLWMVDRRADRQRLIADDSVGAAYLPKLSGDGRTVAYTSARAGSDGFTRVFVEDLATGSTRLAARANGSHGEPAEADAYDPAITHDGRVIAFVSRARNLGPTRPGTASSGGNEGRSAVYVRDMVTRRTTLVSGALADRDVAAPSVSRSGRFVVFIAREGRPDGTVEGLRSSVWLHDRRSGRTRLVSRADGRDGITADGYSSEPVVSADGRRVAFTSTAGNLDSRKPAGLSGVFVRDLRAGTTRLLSTHRPRRDEPGVAPLSLAGLRDWARQRDSLLTLGGLALMGVFATVAARRLRKR